MRFFSILSGFVLVAVAVAGPTAALDAGHIAKRTNPEPIRAEWYRLKLKCAFPGLNNKYLGVKNKIVGVHNLGLEGDGVQVTLNDGGNKGEGTNRMWSLPTYPVGILEHALGLVGRNGYLEFRDLALPSSRAAALSDENTTYSFTEFTVGEPNNDLLRELSYVGKSSVPGWIALPTGGRDEWKIKNYHRDIVVIQNYVPVKIMLEPWYYDQP